MARSIWTGSISFGLVNIPVKLFSAVHQHDVHFHQLAPDGAHIHYKRVSEKSGREVEYENIARASRRVEGQVRHVRTATSSKSCPRRPRRSTSRTSCPRRDRPHLLRAHLLPRAQRTTAATKGYALLAAVMEERERIGHRQRRHARQAVPRRHPAVRQGPGPVDDALADEVVAAVRHRRVPSSARPPSARAREARRADRRLPRRPTGTRAVSRRLRGTPAAVIKAKRRARSSSPRRGSPSPPRCSTSWRRSGRASTRTGAAPGGPSAPRSGRRRRRRSGPRAVDGETDDGEEGHVAPADAEPGRP